MSVPVNVLPEARQDVWDSRTFFDRKQAGLGDRFAAEVLRVLDRIADMPEVYGEVGPGTRAAGVRRFGHVVYFRLVAGGAEVEVIAILHGGRDPKVWQGRV